MRYFLFMQAWLLIIPFTLSAQNASSRETAAGSEGAVDEEEVIRPLVVHVEQRPATAATVQLSDLFLEPAWIADEPVAYQGPYAREFRIGSTIVVATVVGGFIVFLLYKLCTT